MIYFGRQVGPDFFPYAKEKGAKYLVAVEQIALGSSEDWLDRVEAAISRDGFVKGWPGGDAWDNPCMCIVGFSTKEAADECARKFPDSEVRAL